MALNLGLLLLILIVALGVGYAIARTVLGPQAARRNLLYAIPWILAGAILPLILASVGRYGLVILYGLYAGSVLLWLLSWPLRKKGAGDLLLSVGDSAQNKTLLWVGIGLIGLAIAMTLPLLDQLTGPIVTTGSIVAGIVTITFWWVIPLMLILLGRSKLEIRENGLAHLFAWQPWERIQAFGWDDDKPNTLILKAFPRTLASRKYLTFSIPTSQQQEVDRLLEDYLLETDLASEMDSEIDDEKDDHMAEKTE
ncbi:MAG: hypothetical protein AAFY33_21615 [Cyanobacteria bacterium J06643_4]